MIKRPHPPPPVEPTVRRGQWGQALCVTVMDSPAARLPVRMMPMTGRVERFPRPSAGSGGGLPAAGPPAQKGEVHVRKTSSYYDSLVGLNERFQQANKPRMKLTLVPDELEDEDIRQVLAYAAAAVDDQIIDLPRSA